jgi:general secretion pathway protein J
MRRATGFTLIELLVAIGVLALMAAMSWRGLDAMLRTQAQTRQHADRLLTLQAGLAQWSADLDARVELPQQPAFEWDGRGLRLTRRSTQPGGDGVLVVAWSRRAIDGVGQWLRWQSPPVRTRGELQVAWTRAAQWAQNPGEEERRHEVAITPLAEWQIYYFRNDAWTNPLSSDAGTTASTNRTAASTTDQAAPDGIRLVLTLPPGEVVSGRLTRDWMRATLGGGKSS